MTIPQTLWKDHPHLFDELRRCISSRWSSNKTARYLSSLVGQTISKNALIGKAARHGMKFNSLQGAPKPKKAKRGRTVTVIEKPKPQAALVVFEGLDFLQLKRDQCHYPQGDSIPFAFCGSPVREGSSYCPDHHKLTHITPRVWGGLS